MEPLVAADVQRIDDLSALPVLRQAVSLSDRLSAVPPAQAPTAPPAQPPAPPPVAQTPDTLPPVFTPPGTAAAQAPAPAADPAPAAHPSQSPSRFETRLNSVYGAMKTAEQRAAEAELKLAQLLQNINQPPPAAPAQYAPPPPAYNPPSPSFVPSQAPAPVAPPSEFISRQELGAILQERDAQLAAEAQLRQAHTISRLEAERQYPDVFENPSTRAALDRVWSQDRFLQSDPRGPEKAAALVRGMFFDPRAAVATGYAPAVVQKQGAGGLGVSAPGDTGAATTSPQLTAALARARATGRREDWAAAYRLFGPMP